MRQRLLAVVLAIMLISGQSVVVAKAAASEEAMQQRYYAIIYHTVAYRSGLGHEWSDWIAKAIVAYSYKWGVNPLLITAKYAVESNFRMDAYSSAGAIGIAQLMPGTASMIGVDPYDPAGNIEGGIIYYRKQLDAFSYAGDWAATYAVAAYNAGPGAIQEYGGIPPYAETINHLYRVGEIFNALQAEFEQGAG